MSERFSIDVEFRGIDDVSDEARSVAEGLRKVGQVTEELNSKTAEVLRRAREERNLYRAIAEEAQVFGERSQFVARQIDSIARFGGQLNSVFNSMNVALTRLNTAQLALNEARNEELRLVSELNARYGLSATSLEELATSLKALREEYVSTGASTKEIDAAIRSVETAQRELSRAQQEVANSTAQLNAQLFALGLQSIGMIPQLMQVVNSMSALAALSPQLLSSLNAIKVGFMGLYASLGPVGIAAMGIAIAAGLIVANWQSIAPIFEQIAAYIASSLGPALQWLNDGVVRPLGEAIEWFHSNVLRPLADFIVSALIVYVESWIESFETLRRAGETVIDSWRALSSAAHVIWRGVHDAVLGWIDRIVAAVESLVNATRSAFEFVYNVLVGHSIVPELWSEVYEITYRGIDRTLSEIERFRSTMDWVGYGRAIGGPVSIYVTVNTRTDASPSQIAEAVSRELARRIRTLM